MTNLARYHAANLPELMEKISKHGIGMDDYLDRFFNSDFPESNYPPYNLIQLNNHESTLEIALAGFKKDELQVFTEFGKLFVEGRKEESKVDGELSIKDWPNVPLNASGRSPMIRRLDPSSLKTDSSPYS